MPPKSDLLPINPAKLLLCLLASAGAALAAGPMCSISTMATYAPGEEITLEGQCLDENGTAYPDTLLTWIVEHNRDTVRSVQHFAFGKAISTFTSKPNDGAMDWYFVKLSVTSEDFVFIAGTDMYMLPESGETAIMSLGSFVLNEYANGHGPIEIGTSVGEEMPGDGNPITMRGGVYESGIGVHAGSDVGVNLDYRCAYFVSDIGVDDEKGGAGSVVFKVKANDETLFASGQLSGSSPVERIAVKLHSAKEIRLIVEEGDDGMNSDHADWAGAHLICGTAATGTTGARRPRAAAAGLDLAAMPATGSIRFRFSLPAPGATILELHDASGRLLATPVSGNMGAGTHFITWNLPASSRAGLVFATLRTGRSAVSLKVAGGMR